MMFLYSHEHEMNFCIWCFFLLFLCDMFLFESQKCMNKPSPSHFLQKIPLLQLTKWAKWACFLVKVLLAVQINIVDRKHHWKQKPCKHFSGILAGVELTKFRQKSHATLWRRRIHFLDYTTHPLKPTQNTFFLTSLVHRTSQRIENVFVLLYYVTIPVLSTAPCKITEVKYDFKHDGSTQV